MCKVRLNVGKGYKAKDEWYRSGDRDYVTVTKGLAGR